MVTKESLLEQLTTDEKRLKEQLESLSLKKKIAKKLKRFSEHFKKVIPFVVAFMISLLGEHEYLQWMKHKEENPKRLVLEEQVTETLEEEKEKITVQDLMVVPTFLLSNLLLSGTFVLVRSKMPKKTKKREEKKETIVPGEEENIDVRHKTEYQLILKLKEENLSMLMESCPKEKLKVPNPPRKRGNNR